MSSLSYADKLPIEKLLGMGNGYVLNFSDRTFQEFTFESIGIDPYAPGMDAGGTSKAKRLRHMFKVQPDHLVSKLLVSLYDFYEATESQPDEGLLEKCRAISSRLSSHNPAARPSAVQSSSTGLSPHAAATGAQSTAVPAIAQLEALLRQFEELAASSDVHHRGYLLEELLAKTFDLNQIGVVRSFRRNKDSEQIDAAFKLEGWHYLVECRWREKLADTRQVDGLRGQVQRSGKQTMGLFLSINGWTSHVPENLRQNPDKSVLLMDGYDLRVVLEGRIGLQELLLAKLTHFNVECEPFVSVTQILSSRL